jgi:hypothetical protein
VGRSWGLVVVVLVVNVAMAAVLAVPLSGLLERELRQTESAANMLYGFDTAWWSRWNDAQPGWTKSFSPELFGVGFSYRNLDLLLRGELPLGLFRTRAGTDDDDAQAGAAGGPGIDPVILGLAALYLLVQTFLLGGILGALRSEQGSWSVRSLLHGSGFYFGRLLRVALVALLVDWLIFALNAPLARWADAQAREAVSENTAMALALGRHALLLLALLLVNMLSCLAKVLIVLEERSSAILAWLSAIGFCARNLARTVGHYVAVVACGFLLLLGWQALDGLVATTGYKTQIVTLLLAQGLVLGRIALRLSILAGQMALYRRQAALV